MLKLASDGLRVGPRGLGTREITGVSVTLHDPRENIIASEARKLSYRFLVAEWLWIWFGHDDVETITHYNRHIAQFSDNGVDFNGSYGVPVKAQWPVVENLLRRDPASRQAIIQIFGYGGQKRESKDVPCTLSFQFFIRQGKLELIATMRSSDIWLGFPYDAFNFTMMQNIMAALLGVQLGTFTLNIGSSHLYDRNENDAQRVLLERESSIRSPRLVAAPPEWLDDILSRRPANLAEEFDGNSPIMPWIVYSQVLNATLNADAKSWLQKLSSD